jgi:hypothetical protein
MNTLEDLEKQLLDLREIYKNMAANQLLGKESRDQQVLDDLQRIIDKLVDEYNDTMYDA